MKRVGWFVLLATLVALAIGPAAAVTISGYDPRFIEIDGNITPGDGTCAGTPCVDWQTKQTDGTLIGITDGIGNQDGNILSPGPILSTGSTLPKQDITRVWLSNNNTHLYLAEERRANNGNSAYHLFFTKISPTFDMGKPVVFHVQDGDIEIAICFPRGSNPGEADIEVRQASGLTGVVDVDVDDIWAMNLFSPDGATTDFAINTAPTTALTGAKDSKGNPTDNYDTACFAEAAVSLRDLNIDVCDDEMWATVVTRSSCSLTSDVKDISAPVLYNFGGPELDELDWLMDCDNVITLTTKVLGGTLPLTVQCLDNDTVIFEDTLSSGSLPIPISIEKTLTPGTHKLKVVVTDPGGCSDTKETDEFTVNSLLSLSDISKSVDCKNLASLSATASGGQSPYSFVWYDGETQIRSAPDAGATDSFTTTLSAGTHTIKVVVTDANGCTKEKTATVVVYSLLSVSLSGAATCPGDVTWTATPTGGAGGNTYLWKLDGVTVNGTGTSYSYGPSVDCASHTVCVTVTDSRGCTATACKKITQSATSTISDP